MIDRKGVAWVCEDGDITDSWPIAENWESGGSEVKEMTEKQYEIYQYKCFDIGQDIFHGGNTK